MPVLYNPITYAFTYVPLEYDCKCKKPLIAGTSHCRLCHQHNSLIEAHICSFIEESEDGKS